MDNTIVVKLMNNIIFVKLMMFVLEAVGRGQIVVKIMAIIMLKVWIR